MAGGPIYPSSAYPNSSAGLVFPNFYAGGGGNAAPHDEGLGVAASLSANATWELRFPMPPTIPSGTLKLRLLALANASSGSAYFQVADGHCPAASSPSAATLTTENGGNSYTVTWTATAGSTADDYLETKIALSAAPAGNDVLIVSLTFNSTQVGGAAASWSLAAVSTWLASILWE
jgi:hypothetical protein